MKMRLTHEKRQDATIKAKYIGKVTKAIGRFGKLNPNDEIVLTQKEYDFMQKHGSEHFEIVGVVDSQKIHVKGVAGEVSVNPEVAKAEPSTEDEDEDDDGNEGEEGDDKTDPPADITPPQIPAPTPTPDKVVAPIKPVATAATVPSRRRSGRRTK